MGSSIVPLVKRQQEIEAYTGGFEPLNRMCFLLALLARWICRKNYFEHFYLHPENRLLQHNNITCTIIAYILLFLCISWLSNLIYHMIAYRAQTRSFGNALLRCISAIGFSVLSHIDYVSNSCRYPDGSLLHFFPLGFHLKFSWNIFHFSSH